MKAEEGWEIFWTTLPEATHSRADKQKNCALYEESMKFLAWLADTIRFIFRCGGKLDLASEDRERSKFKCAYN